MPTNVIDVTLVRSIH